jgi:hypothetical protein
MLFKVYLLRSSGRRLPRRDVFNGPKHVGHLLTHSIDIGGERYNVAKLRPNDPMASDLVPELYEPVLLGFSILAFRLRGYERVDSARGVQGVVQEWHCEPPDK